MPLTLNVGVSKKLGLPEFSSVGASCTLQLELDAMLIHTDLDGLHEQIRGAFVAARQAVDAELAGHRAHGEPRAPVQPVTTNGNDHHGGRETRGNGSPPKPNGTPVRADRARGRAPRPATAGQVKAIYAIARVQHADLEGLLRDEYGVERPEDLSLADASAF